MRLPDLNWVEDRLSQPCDADAEAVAGLGGELLILGVGGKMGPSLARLARRAADLAKVPLQIRAVARFSNRELVGQLEAAGIETISCDLLEPGALEALPNARNVIFMAARKFGTTGEAHLTWAMNTYLPGRVAERYRKSNIVAFSTGNVYPLRQITRGGATELTPPAPVGEYAQSALGRERMFEYGSAKWGTRVAILRLNYAVEMRYGVLVDIARAVFERRPVDVRMGYVNVIWQGDANSNCLRAFGQCASPPCVLNITGPEVLRVRDIADQFGRLFGVAPQFSGEEAGVALLNDAAKSHGLFGLPQVPVEQVIEWTAHWIEQGGSVLNKPTHFEVQDGKF